LLYFKLLLFSLVSFGQNLPNDCVSYIQLCDNQSVAYNVSGLGIQEIVPPSCSAQESNSIWFRVTIEQMGILSFELIPLSTNINEDYDFWVFGPNVTCGNLGSPIRCSTTNPAAAGQANNHTGLNAASADLFEGPGQDGDSFVRQIPVSAGQSYFIVIDRPIGNSPFTLNWTGTAIIENPFQNYVFDDFEDVEICDSGNDNSELFDFSTLSADYLASTNGEFTITYHQSQEDAVFNNFPLIGLVPVTNGTYYARISNTLTVCFETRSLEVILGEIEVNNANVLVCENTPTQEATVNLSNYESQIYQDNQLVNFYYYPTQLDAENLTSEITNTSALELPLGLHVFYVRVTYEDCFSIASLAIDVKSRPIVNTNISLKQCDDDLDGFSAFNLTEANSLLMSNPLGITFEYYPTLLAAEQENNLISNPFQYTNQIAGFDQVFVRITNTFGCFKIEKLDLIVTTTLIPLTLIQEYIACDDLTSGSNQDGIASFDFSGFTTDILNLFPVGQQLSVTYYTSIEDALEETNAILNSSTFSNTNSPFIQPIFIRIESDLNNACVGLGHHIDLIVEPIPIANSLEIIVCDDDYDGLFSFDTSTIESNLLDGISNVSVTYFDENNQVLSSPLPNPFVSTSQIIQVTVTNNTSLACSFQTTIKLVVDVLPKAFMVPFEQTQLCDDEVDPLLQDGILDFDTSGIQADILGGQTGMLVEYRDENNLLLSSPLPNPFQTASQVITATVINPSNTTCFATVQIPFVVFKTPKIQLDDEVHYVCKNDSTYTVTLSAGLINENTIANFSYQWFLNQTALENETNYTLTTNQSGTYTVEVTSDKDCFKTRTIQVLDSEIAILENIEINDLIDDNSIVVLVSGVGEYVYSLDGFYYQESNVFYDVDPGVLTVYIKDLRGCGVLSEQIQVLGILKFFTPNGDGFNDVWGIRGISSSYQVDSKLTVFDRYGKLVYQFKPSLKSWDGTFNGNALPSDDYWFVLEMADGRTVKGHFSLKR
jgi:gliding motility-associated-like protein